MKCITDYLLSFFYLTVYVSIYTVKGSLYSFLFRNYWYLCAAYSFIINLAVGL